MTGHDPAAYARVDMAEFEAAVAAGKPVLLACLGASPGAGDQEALLDAVAGLLPAAVRIMVPEEASLAAFVRRHNILGTPTFLFFLQGREQDHLLGRADAATLAAFVRAGLEGASPGRTQRAAPRLR